MSLPAATAPRLTKLELQGFKSFASRTTFVFESGITAVIGPNGSGKSNIADAVRWVLGEQSYSALRGKKSEDVIFAGGHGRAPAGMAEVTVTFDNSSRWLPIEFTEVSVTRRVFRASGGESQNQYLINGRRVRLKDIAQLTASLGQSHTVVGQGLVDAALSQRAEERRALFEHAADLTGLRLKAAEAERNLAETEANSARLSDLLTELAPRLRSLERAARQAHEWRELRGRLRRLQQGHFRQQLTAAVSALVAAETAAETDEQSVQAAQAALDDLTSQEAAARQQIERARVALAQHDADLEEQRERLRHLTHDRDLAAERQTALRRRRDDMADTQSGLDEQAAAVRQALATLTEALQRLQTELADARQTVAAKQRQGVVARRARGEIERELAKLTTTLHGHERTEHDLTRRRAVLEQRQAAAETERKRLSAAVAERAARIERQAAEVAAFDRAAADGASKLTALDERLAKLTTTMARAKAAAETARETTAKVARQLDQAMARRDALQRLHDSGTGLYAGVRATLQAAHKGTLTGIRGTVAELIEVPAIYDTAIEVALGGHLQDVVVERWADAEAAIQHLKRTNAGRATFQPLDTVRHSTRGGRGLPAEVLARSGVRGIAADLVGGDADLTGVIQALLGRVVIVNDLSAARQTLPQLPPGWSAVTLGGEIARTGGSVTGGAAVRESGVLSRERELRQLPGNIARLRQASETAATEQRTAQAEIERLTEERRQIEAERAGHLAAQRERQTQRNRLQTWLTDLQREQANAERQQQQLGHDNAAAVAELAAIEAEQATLASQVRDAQAAQTRLRQTLADETAAASATERELAVAQRELAMLEERWKAEQRRQTDLTAQQRALADELSLRTERAAALEREQATLAAEHTRLVEEVRSAEQQVQAAVAQRAPEADSLKANEARVAGITGAIETARTELRQREHALGASELTVERSRGVLAALRQRISDELDLTDPDSLLADSSDVAESSSPEETEREIGRLKERLRRIGYIGDDAVEEYEREAAHQTFLQTQLADVQGAAASLRTLLADLQTTMRTRFEETFTRVAEVFSDTFTTLFGGGTARLVLTPGEDGAAVGVDIVAQPPGKRLQNLALLSGGERALTAVALLLAILRVNPAPFCLLDEVDAALDEANVVRVRARLRELARETQVIVITHNRGTIEIADTLYGISMGDDGISQSLSLRLAAPAAS